MHVVQPETYRKWVRQSRQRIVFKPSGGAMTNDVLDEAFQPQPHGTVRCKQQLGGLIKSYYREAA